MAAPDVTPSPLDGAFDPVFAIVLFALLVGGRWSGRFFGPLVLSAVIGFAVVMRLVVQQRSPISLLLWALMLGVLYPVWAAAVGRWPRFVPPFRIFVGLVALVGLAIIIAGFVVVTPTLVNPEQRDAILFLAGRRSFATALCLVLVPIVACVAARWRWEGRSRRASDTWDWFAPWITVHTLPRVFPPTRQGLIQTRALLSLAFPDLQLTQVQVVREGDRVALHSTARGTHTGLLSGLLLDWPEDIPPTGRALTWSEIVLYRTEHGRGVEMWFYPDRLAILRGVGALPQTWPPGAG